mgnify:CR=1 FL=1
MNHRQSQTLLPYITEAGRAKLQYYDRQIAISQARSATNRRDVDYVAELSGAVVARAKATGDGRDIQNALALIDEVNDKQAAKFEEELFKQRKRLADAERLAQQMIEEAKGRASEEAAKIIAAARAEAARDDADEAAVHRTAHDVAQDRAAAADERAGHDQ